MINSNELQKIIVGELVSKSVKEVDDALVAIIEDRLGILVYDSLGYLTDAFMLISKTLELKHSSEYSYNSLDGIYICKNSARFTEDSLNEARKILKEIEGELNNG